MHYKDTYRAVALLAAAIRRSGFSEVKHTISSKVIEDAETYYRWLLKNDSDSV